ncbi:MAG TPA: 50S ribosomal protein L6 [Acidimicrobiia bacterium]|nr:50S ribosomal protein L6 [Acidimicrobiia bacterium]
MSRVGKNPITLPKGVEIRVEGAHLVVKGDKGQLEHDLPEGIGLEQDGEVLTITRASDARQQRALHGLTRALVANMIVGVSEGYAKRLEIVGVGYRCAAQGPTALELQLGYSHPVKFEAPDGVTFEVPEPTKISVLGIDKQLVGQVAADIRKLRKPEPYKGKGIRYADEYVRRKAGKAAGA